MLAIHFYKIEGENASVCNVIQPEYDNGGKTKFYQLREKTIFLEK